MKRIALVAFLVAVGGSSFAVEPHQDPTVRPAAEQKKNILSEQEMKKTLEGIYGVMVPIAEKMTDAIIDSSLKTSEKPEAANRIAAFKKNLYDALIRQGFSKGDAFQIVVNTPLPVASLF